MYGWNFYVDSPEGGERKLMIGRIEGATRELAFIRAVRILKGMSIPEYGAYWVHLNQSRGGDDNYLIAECLDAPEGHTYQNIRAYQDHSPYPAPAEGVYADGKRVQSRTQP